LNVLFVNHTSDISGAERSLLDLIAAQYGCDEALLACPEGELALRARSVGIPTVAVAFPEFGFKAGFGAAVRAAWGLAGVALRLRRLANRHDADIVRAASTRAGLALCGCAFSRRKRVVDIRDVLPSGRKAELVRFVLRHGADELVFNSRFTWGRFGPTRPATGVVSYPHVELRPFLDLARSPRGDDRAPVLGIVGQITPWKAQDDAIRILNAVREPFPGTRLRIVGRTVFSGSAVSLDNGGFARSLEVLAGELGLADAVEFTGEVDDLRPVYESLDVLLVPSWEEPFGRVVAEAMAAAVPVVATTIGGPAELIADGVSGMLAPPREPDAWVGPVRRLLEDPAFALRLGERGRLEITKILHVERTSPEPTERPRFDAASPEGAAL
jgi:glycosyltransferase involved in cell wall biosynthesis